MNGNEADAHDTQAQRPPFRWVVFGAMCGVYFAFGVILLAITPMVTEVRADLDITRSALGFALGAWALIYIVTAPPTGRLIDRIGIRASLAIGSLLIAVSGVVQASAQGPATLWFAVAIIGIGGPLVSLSAPKLVALWFEDAAERPLAVGIYTSAPALGGVAALVLTNPVLLPALGDWRRVLVAEALLNVVAGAVWLAVSGRAPAAPGHAPPLAGEAPGRGSIRALIASPGVRLALALGMGSFFVNQGLAAWLPNMLETDSAMTASSAATWAAASLTVGIATRLTIPGFATAHRRSALLQLVMVVLALSMVAMALGPASTDAPASLALGVRSALTSLVIVVLMEAEGVTRENTAAANGLWFSVAEMGGATGPLAVGALADLSGGFSASLMMMAAILGAMMALVAAHDRRRTQRKDHPRAHSRDQR